MDNYLLKICSNKDINSIKDEEEREEAQEQFEDEIESIYYYLKQNELNSVFWTQIDDTRFKIQISTYKDRFNRDIMSSYMDDIRYLLKRKNIAFPIVENYRSLN